MYRYELKDNTVKVYAEGAEIPFLSQESYPNGEVWTTAEATAWAEVYVESLNNPDSQFVVGYSRANPKIKRPEPMPEPVDSDLLEPDVAEAASEAPEPQP